MRATFLIGLSCALAATTASAGTLTFSTSDNGPLVHGSVVSNPNIPTAPGGTFNDPFGSRGITITAQTFRFDPQPGYAIIFDAGFDDPTTDDDLLGPPWLGGNFTRLGLEGEELGNLLILAENIDDDVAPFGVVDDPDDEGQRPAGTFTFDFSTPLTSIGFDLVDIENVESKKAYVATFYDGANPIGVINFKEFKSGGAFDRDATFDGDNSANRIAPITVEELNAAFSATLGRTITSFDRVDIRLGGSGAIDNLTYNPVPEPSSLALLAVGGFTCLIRRRRRSEAA